jgi:phospholipid/cholesterol/gamma-HCH transport system substrate-binding protein
VARNAAELAAGAAVLVIAAGFLLYGVASTGRGATGGYALNAEFDNIGALAPGADVRIAGVKVGSVTSTRFNPQNFRARVQFNVGSDVHLPTDSSAQISSAGLLGGVSLSLVPGGADDDLKPGGTVGVTQSAANLEDLLGKFIFNVGALADASQKQLDRAAKP